MNFLEYFGVDTTKYEYLELITDFTLNASITYSVYSSIGTLGAFYNNDIYFYNLIIDNLNKDNEYCSKLYTLLIKDSSVCRKYIIPTSGGYKISYANGDIRTTCNSFPFSSSDMLYYSIRQKRIVKVLITSNFIELFYDTSHYINNFDGLTIDTTIPQSEVSKIEQKFKEEQESQGFVSAKTVFEAIENSNKESNNMNFLEYFGVDTTKYEWLDLKTDFEIVPTYTNPNVLLLEEEIVFRLYLDNLNKSNEYLNKLYNLFSNSPNQYYLRVLDKISFTGYNIKCIPSDRSYFHKFTSTYESFRRLKYLPNRNRIIRVLINKDNINLYFDDSLISTFGYNYMPNTLSIDTTDPQYIEYEKWMGLSREEKATGSYLISGLKTAVKENEDLMNDQIITSTSIIYNKNTSNHRSYLYKVLPASQYLFNESFIIDEIKFRDKGGTTIVFWKDGTKTILKKQKGEKNDIEKVVAMAYMKKALSMMPTAKQRDMNNIITHAKVKYWQDVAEAKKIEEEKAKKAAKKKQKQEEANKLKEESKKKPTHRSSKK